jgi:predicted DNA-binding transcriptional regulator AlpA
MTTDVITTVISETLMDPSATAAFLLVAVPTLADWRTKGIGPTYIKVGRCVRYRLSDLDKWLTSRTQLDGRRGKERA